MARWYCPTCASHIVLDTGVPFVYCKICGDKVFYTDASEYKLSKELLANKERLQSLNPEDLLTIGKNTKGAYGEELLILAAEKKHGPAVLYLGIHYYFAEKLQACKEYLETAAQTGSVDARTLLLILRYKCADYSDAENVLAQLQAECSKNFEYAQVQKHGKEYVNIIEKNIIERKRRAAESNHLDSYHIHDFMLPDVNEPGQETEHGPLATATNAGMPVITGEVW